MFCFNGRTCPHRHRSSCVLEIALIRTDCFVDECMRNILHRLYCVFNRNRENNKFDCMHSHRCYPALHFPRRVLSDVGRGTHDHIPGVKPVPQTARCEAVHNCCIRNSDFDSWNFDWRHTAERIRKRDILLVDGR
ncbi:hypothetical protein DPMN_131139 [Dreissena polymorpha]|uniref:Uncharacterized protein n=1 Tax=Dreissena polymorpha TaxID=45954 RepID=A0A9D4H607_DREPO|nr:hypothetical protein DPMN_131139 [Dreissena polymorpha]